MRFHALACDYDGTIAKDGKVDEPTLAALRRLSATGRKLILVTGRELQDLQKAFDELGVFDWVVAENGALLYEPESREETAISEPISIEFVKALRKRGVAPLSVGKVIVATWQPNEQVVLDTIREQGLELNIIFNKGAVMVLPTGVNKATGLMAALERLELSPHNVAGIGDAENDHAFLRLCEFSAATANALPALKDAVTWVSKGDHGAGVAELIDHLIDDDLSTLAAKTNSYCEPMGFDTRDQPVEVPVFGENMLFVGSSGSGKSTLAKGFIEKLADRSYQFCIIDPEGDYEDFEEGVVLGDPARVPSPEEVLQVLRSTNQNPVVNLLGVALGDRPLAFTALLVDLQELRSRTGRPHWIICDEAHHLLPRDRPAGSAALPVDLNNVVYVTTQPDVMLREAVEGVTTVCAVGETAQELVTQFARVTRSKVPALPKRKLAVGEALMWRRGEKVRRFKMAPTRLLHRRHRRKYAEGDVGPERSFYFRGEGAALNLRAQNLIIFAQIAKGVDEDTWAYHLKRKDYSRWFRDVIKDDGLAERAEKIEGQRLTVAKSRERILEAIADRYTLPAEAPSGIVDD
jgi:HAD superfamily hydrolase (TIGR01484 family)